MPRFDKRGGYSSEYSHSTKLLASFSVKSRVLCSTSLGSLDFFSPSFLRDERTLEKVMGMLDGNWINGRCHERVSCFARRIL